MDKKVSKKRITEQTVRYVAALSRIELDEAETASYKDQLSDIIGYIEQLGEVDTDNTLPTTHVLPSMKNVFREDELKESLSPDEFLGNAPEKHGNFFKVPRIIQSS
ncbi:MAG: Asp-tRNA(Asn)/Glu-tRNA(Gln) amidotransferase subunit GatC [Candidatus Omnitrophica bacterium]|nr:Asp-tRNA(Asn)/Glu-tRNA(Gln) amidotransferase subunit GatC [Candidatus Omnitrophota bacterium]